MDEDKKFYVVTDVMRVLNIGEAKAYQIIRTLNKELKAKGKITVQGRVSRKYFEERVLV